jgi:hypothetical protein
MIGGFLRLMRKYPNVLLLLAGLWIAALPVGFAFYVEDHILSTNAFPQGLDAALYDIHRLPYAEGVAIAIFFLGCGTSLAAICCMIKPWVYPK